MLDKGKIISLALTVLVVFAIIWGLFSVASTSLKNRVAEDVCRRLTLDVDVHPRGGSVHYEHNSGEWSCIWFGLEGEILDEFNLGTDPAKVSNYR